MLEGEFGQDVDIGGVAGLGLFDYGQFELIEEDLSELLGGIDVKDLACQTVDPLHFLLELNLQLLRIFLEEIRRRSLPR